MTEDLSLAKQEGGEGRSIPYISSSKDLTLDIYTNFNLSRGFLNSL